MIRNGVELEQSLQQMQRMYQALASLRAEVEPQSPRRFALLAEGPLEEIRRLNDSINDYVGIAAVQESEADIWLRVRGRTVTWPETPTSILTALLDALRKGVQLVAEYLERGRLAARPTKEIKRSCDLRLVAFRAGSLEIGMRLPEEFQENFLPSEQEPPPARALKEYLRIARWAASDASVEELEQLIEDGNKRRLLLNALKPFVPRPRGDVDLVEISGPFTPSGQLIRLSRGACERIDRAIDRIVHEQVETHEGELREIDLDNLSFILRNIGDVHEIHCTFEGDLLEASKEALDRRVRVTGIRRMEEGRRLSGLLRVARLEILDDDDVSATEPEHPGLAESRL